VKVCSLYGAGFYYIPGTDICLKLGGYVRYQVNYNPGSITAGPFSGGNSFNDRVNDPRFAQRTRALLAIDTRQQTAYGTLRTYMVIGYTQDTNANTGLSAVAGANTPLYANRGFIQIAGFTFGKATSYFDFVSTAAVAYNAGFTHAPDTGDGGQIVGAYTAQFGNGVSASIAIEQSRRNNTWYAGTATPASLLVAFGPDNNAPGGVSATNTNQSVWPDFVANLRVDQAWGAAQISGALHDVSAGYYGSGPAGSAIVDANGHPPQKFGFAVSAGLRINTPMIGPGDYFQAAAVYSEGAIRYASLTPISGGLMQYFQGNKFAFGQANDAAFGGTRATGDMKVHLTTAWSAFASYEHFWTPSLRTSWYGSYLKVTQDDIATLGFCTIATTGSASISGATVAGCTPNWSAWNFGTRSQWNVTKDFYVGLDVIYSRINSASLGPNPVFLTSTLLPAAGGRAPGLYSTADLDTVSATWRVHRDIVP
jgi:hypothetical protein